MDIIEINNLTKTYGKARGISNVKFSLKQGEIFGFIGPNGAGKSTTIRTLLGFLKPTSGSASIFGMDIVKDTQKIKQRIGYMPSEVNYYSNMKTQDVLKYSASFYGKDCKERTQELAEIFQVDMKKKMKSLSLGNKKKVAILQALIHEPELLILDEPTNGLDPLMQSTFFEVLKKEQVRGVTIFFSSHVLSEVQKVCDRVAIIKEGKILNVDRIETLRNNNYKRIKLHTESTENITLSNVQNVTREGELVEFLYNGDMNELVSYLSKIEMNNLSVEELSLEEIFMHYYEKGGVE
ncbi:MAG: ABC transporter ATP-binding protein [Clostridium sp.]|nr:ABC transporter ATP-binding protein [Clostridium sp.]